MGTHTETYRPFRGTKRRHPLRFAPLAGAGIHVAAKNKLPLLLLFLLPAAWTVVFCFNVYMKFALEQNVAEGGLAGLPANAAMKMASRMIDVRKLIDNYFLVCRLFGVLVAAWFGAGLLCDDRRRGAHLLYFARPLNRLDYLLGKLFTLLYYGSMAILVPGLLICGTAAFSSPDWVWLETEGEVVVGTVVYGVLAVLFYSVLTLAVSSLAPSKPFAIAGVFGLVLVPHAAGHALARLSQDTELRILSPLSNFDRIASDLLETPTSRNDWDPAWSYAYVLAVIALGLALVWWRIRRLETVA